MVWASARPRASGRPGRPGEDGVSRVAAMHQVLFIDARLEQRPVHRRQDDGVQHDSEGAASNGEKTSRQGRAARQRVGGDAADKPSRGRECGGRHARGEKEHRSERPEPGAARLPGWRELGSVACDRVRQSQTQPRVDQVVDQSEQGRPDRHRGPGTTAVGGRAASN